MSAGIEQTREQVLDQAPERCRRCAHLATLTAHGDTTLACLRGREISGTCGWWRPRRLSFYESAVLPAPSA